MNDYAIERDPPRGFDHEIGAAPPLGLGTAAPVARLEFINLAAWEGEPVPERDWVVKNRIPLGHVTLLSGEGGVGKSILALQLCHAQALGGTWFDCPLNAAQAMMLSAEDNEEELHRRIAEINRHEQTRFADLGNLHLLSFVGAGLDPILAAPNRSGIIKPTLSFHRLREAAHDIRPRVITIDTAADVFAGNENDRAQTRQFVTMLRELAFATHSGVVLLSHPSLSGINSGSGISGSTAWHNSVRSRLYFTTAKTRDGEEPDKNLRTLEVMKSNYGPVGEKIMLRYQNGVFVVDPGLGSLEKMSAQSAVEGVFLALLDKMVGQGRDVSPMRAPKVFSEMPDNGGYRKKAFNLAQERLLASGPLRIEQHGSPSRKRNRLVRVMR
jgi:RecA-family ATPase